MASHSDCDASFQSTVSHMMAVPSRLPVSAQRPFSENETDVSSCVCPCKFTQLECERRLKNASALTVERTGTRCVLVIVIGLGSQQNPCQRQDPEAIASWARNLTGRCGEGRIAIAVGRHSGPLIHAQMQHENLVIYPIYPKQLARYRESPFPSSVRTILATLGC